MRLAVAASGALGLHCLQQLPKQAHLICVLTDSLSIPVIHWCTENHIPLFKGNPRDKRIDDFIHQYEVDILFSVNYLFILGSTVINWPKKYAFNIHGSLLPKYRGRTPHVWAIINGESTTGFTVHLVDEGCDTGDIVLQQEIAITPGMTGADVLSVFNKHYPEAISKVLALVEENKIFPIKQDHSLATWFGKRTPDDGLVNWNWSSEKIINWVRAQAKPYPGAFSFYYDQKIIIHKVSAVHQPTINVDQNGMVLQLIDKKPVVQTGTGGVLLEHFESSHPLEFKKGERFYG